VSKFAAIFVFTAVSLIAFGQPDSRVVVRTDDTGEYRTPPLPIGAYSTFGFDMKRAIFGAEMQTVNHSPRSERDEK
jgi:hypothetical protein